MPKYHKNRYVSNLIASQITDSQTGEIRTVSEVFASIYPTETGQNVEQRDLLVVKGNTEDSLAGTDLDTFTVAKNNAGHIHPSEIFTTGTWIVEDESLFTAKYVGSSIPRHCKIIFSGRVFSDSSTDSNRVGVRLNSSIGGVLTGTTKVYPVGRLAGQNETDVAFTLIGFGEFQLNEELSLEVSKDFTGTLIIDDVILEVEPLF